MPKFAANLGFMFNEVAFPQRFAAAAAAGFNAVEFLFPYEHTPQQVVGWLNENRLQNVLFNMPPGDWAAGERGIACLPGREQEFRKGVAVALEYAQAMGTPGLHAMSGILPAGADAARHRAVFIDNLRYTARELARHGLMLLIEPINLRDMPGYFLNTQAQAHSIREELGEPNLKVQMDLYHVQVSEGDVATNIRKYFDHIGHIQVASVPERNEPDDGELNYPYLLRLLDQLGYEGWLGCEYRPRSGTLQGLSWLKRYIPAVATP